MINKDEEVIEEMIKEIEQEKHPEYYAGYAQCLQDAIKELTKQQDDK